MESIPQQFGTLMINQKEDENGNESLEAAFTPDFKTPALLQAVDDVFYGFLGAAGGFTFEGGTLGISSPAAVPAIVYGIDQMVSGVITFAKVYRGDYDNSQDNTDNRILRASFKFIGGDGAEKIYDMGNIMINTQGIFRLSTGQSKKFNKFISDLAGAEQLGEQVTKMKKP